MAPIPLLLKLYHYDCSNINIENQFDLFEIINLNISLCNNVHLPCVNKIDEEKRGDQRKRLFDRVT